MKELKFKQFEIDEINEITLLTVGEVEKIPQSFRACDDWWWLRSGGYNRNYTANVCSDGDVDEYGYYVHSNYGAVRPVFKISNLKSEIGDKVMVGKTWCTTIDEGLVLTDKPICKHRFDSKSNDWENSELKKFINSEDFIFLL